MIIKSFCTYKAGFFCIFSSSKRLSSLNFTGYEAVFQMPDVEGCIACASSSISFNFMSRSCRASGNASSPVHEVKYA